MEEQFALLTVGALAGTVSAIVLLLRRQGAARLAAWTRYANRRGYEFRPASGPWFERRPATLVCVVEEVAFEVETVVGSNGMGSSVPCTRVWGRAISPIRCVVRIGDGYQSAGEFLRDGLDDATTGDAAFDDRLTVTASREDDARALLDEPTRKALLAFPPGFRFEYRSGVASLCWSGYETRASVLDAALRVVSAVCRWRRDPTLYR